MSRGHVTGLKRERTGATPEFDRIQAEHLARIEREYAAKAAATTIRPTLTDHDYTDWEVTVDGEQYLVINEQGPDGDWELRQLVHNGWAKDWKLIGIGTDIDAFLGQHRLVLTEAGK
jgi:hypothetical protein